MTEQEQEKEKGLSHAKAAELISKIIKMLEAAGLSNVGISTVLYRAHRAFWPYHFIDERNSESVNVDY